MKTSSRLALGGIFALFALLFLGYRLTRTEPAIFTMEKASALLQRMETAVEKKDAGMLLGEVSSSPGVKLNGLKEEQIRFMLAKAFRSTGKLKATTDNVKFSGGDSEAQVNFHVVVKDYGNDATSELYNANLMMRFRREEVSHYLGLVKSQEWRIVEVNSDGPSLDNFAE
ncbi:MAG: hypothetical protein H7308_13795 [Chthonomonadaceae bacterium]|nr:hypothetical protein [Chthonomonadaceae bacterium]